MKHIWRPLYWKSKGQGLRCLAPQRPLNPARVEVSRSSAACHPGQEPLTLDREAISQTGKQIKENWNESHWTTYLIFHSDIFIGLCHEVALSCSHTLCNSCLLVSLAWISTWSSGRWPTIATIKGMHFSNNCMHAPLIVPRMKWADLWNIEALLNLNVVFCFVLTKKNCLSNNILRLSSFQLKLLRLRFQ